MVIRLDERDKKVFANFIKAVLECKGEECADMIFNLSNYEGQRVKGEKFKKYKQ